MDRFEQSSESAPEFPAPSDAPRSPSHWPKNVAAPDRSIPASAASNPPDHKPASSPAHRDSTVSSSSARPLPVPIAPAPRPHSTPTPPSAHPSNSSLLASDPSAKRAPAPAEQNAAPPPPPAARTCPATPPTDPPVESAASHPAPLSYDRPASWHPCSAAWRPARPDSWCARRRD